MGGSRSSEDIFLQNVKEPAGKAVIQHERFSERLTSHQKGVSRSGVHEEVNQVMAGTEPA